MKQVAFEYSQNNVHSLSEAFCDVPGKQFKVRGEGYLDLDHDSRQDKKVQSGPKTFLMDSVKIFKKSSPVTGKDIAESGSFDLGSPAEDTPDLIVAFTYDKFNLFTSNDFFAACIHSKLNPEVSPGGHAMYKSFVTCMDDEERREVLKFGATFCHMSDSISAIMSMLGARRPVLIGKRLTTNFFKSENAFVVTIDICSNVLVSGIRNMAFEHSDKMIIDLQFILEVKKKVDLPENSLVGFRFHKVGINNIDTIDLG